MSKADPAREQTIQFKSIKSPPLEGNQFISPSDLSGFVTLIGQSNSQSNHQAFIEQNLKIFEQY